MNVHSFGKMLSINKLMIIAADNALSVEKYSQIAKMIINYSKKK